jgi:predicted house-cleaning noncanonical NTP pyrophosphatase (MazG superfamily)
MSLSELLRQKRTQLINSWFDKLINTYPDESAKFFGQQKNQFSNPVGHTFRTSLEKIFDELLEDKCSEKIKDYVDAITRIRAIQGFRPSEAIAYVYFLKDSILEVLQKEIKERGLFQELLNFQYKLDQLTALTFDIYMQCREQLWEQRANFLNSRTHKLLERANLIKEVEG